MIRQHPRFQKTADHLRLRGHCRPTSTACAATSCGAVDYVLGAGRAGDPARQGRGVRRAVPQDARARAAQPRARAAGARADRRARGVDRAAAGERGRAAARPTRREGRVPGHALARAAHAAATRSSAGRTCSRSGELDPEQQAARARDDQPQRRGAGQLIDDILDVSRIVTGKLRLETRPVELRGGRRGGARDRAAGGRGEADRARADARRAGGRRARATPRGCSRWSGTCSRTRSSSRRRAGGVEVRLRARRTSR